MRNPMMMLRRGARRRGGDASRPISPEKRRKIIEHMASGLWVFFSVSGRTEKSARARPSLLSLAYCSQKSGGNETVPLRVTEEVEGVLRWAGELGTEPPIPLLFDAESAIETAIQAWRQKKKSAARFNRGSVVVNNALVEALVTKMLLFWDIIPCVSAAVGFANLHRASSQQSQKYLRVRRDRTILPLLLWLLKLAGTQSHSLRQVNEKTQRRCA